jgi:hypothetical protein
MRILLLGVAAGILGLATVCRADDWALEQSTITYFVSHPLHHVDGISSAARGKGVCAKERCDFLVGIPVKSFDSGDSNRDLHMLQVTRGGEFPMIVVRTSAPEKSAGSAIAVDLEIQFVGRTASYKGVQFQRVDQDDLSRISGTIPLKISDFKIIPPSLLAVPIDDDVPVKVEMTWRKKVR